MHELTQWVGCFFGVLGATLLAMNNRYSRFGFVAFLASNSVWLVDGWITHTMGLVTMQLAFTITSLIGIKNWFLAQRRIGCFAGYVRTPRGDRLRLDFHAPVDDEVAQRAAAMAALEKICGVDWLIIGDYKAPNQITSESSRTDHGRQAKVV